MTTDGKPTALIVHENGITASRLKSIMSQRGWDSQICDDGDKAVDEYVKMNPHMVFLGLNLPTMDGHVAALEIRESDPEARVVFVVSKSRLSKANDAAYSAGAVSVLVTPLTRADIDQKWVLMNGPIPDAPGLADLDTLYPDLEEELPDLPPLSTPQFPEGPSETSAPPSPMMTPPEPPKPKRKRRPLRILIPLAIIGSIGFGVAFYLGFVEL
ncbi:MAG: response regulator [Candidatus Thalassarchaeaceae archaeon]|nr:response regulator [Candidatus Thalassarchaeaceae archaeon]